MKSIRFGKLRRRWLLSTTLSSFLCAQGAWATLGRDYRSVQADEVHMKAARRMTHSETAYSVHQLNTPAGTVIREYVSADGKVFGVAWQGPWLPDFRQLLGDYYGPVMQSPRHQRQGRGPLVLNQPEIVFHSAGHMRSFFGKAYVPAMLPKGITADVVQ